ncbi:MAG: restriction endonuclease, SacI family [Pseudomonadota bacterium]|nr:restriction endonuclease, SacI family [Pseudomonadota bacterium]MDE3038026.1 restriction endonuclease, SacI family [Pseudomonadota bacterium]
MGAEQILQHVYEKASNTLKQTVITDETIRARVDYICRCSSNRAGVRLLMSCLLGNLDNPKVDPRKPYTEIGGNDSFSGRTYDERYLTHFINTYRLPCNPTTAFLTPGLRNIDRALTTDIQIIGRPRELYVEALQVLDDVHRKRINAETVFVETVRVLINMRDETLGRMTSLMDSLKRGAGALPLSSEAILNLLEQHIACKNSSRLPVLMVSAAYRAAEAKLGERPLPLHSHNAADLQTGSIGDVEICLIGDDNVVTAYEMKMKHVTIDDIDSAITKISHYHARINNYIFITTEIIERAVVEYAAKFYEETGGTEIVILDCLGFLKHFLHLFHRIRTDFLNAYQEMVMAEPDSAVSQALKEAFLVLRQAAESGE